MAVSENINSDIKNDIKKEKNLYYQRNQINKDKINYETNKRRKRRL